MKTIAIVTPWQNHLELAADYFAAVDVAQPDQVVVVDDRSDPPLPFASARIETAGGFCTASNVGLRLAETDLVVFLNNDIAPLRPNWLEEFRAMIEPGVVVGPLQKPPHCHVDGVAYPYVDGWALGMTTSDAVGLRGWDERYDEAGPSYFSDTAFSFQARWQGFRLRELRPGLVHKGGRTGGSGPAFERSLRVNSAMFEEQVRALVGSGT